MPEINAQISWVYTHDPDATCRFYRDGLGLECVRDEGGAWIYATAAGARIGVCQAFEDRVVEPRGGMISLVTDDVDAWYACLIERDIEVAEPPRRLERFGIRTFFVSDPNGYIIELQQFETNG